MFQDRLPTAVKYQGLTIVSQATRWHPSNNGLRRSPLSKNHAIYSCPPHFPAISLVWEDVWQEDKSFARVSIEPCDFVVC